MTNPAFSIKDEGSLSREVINIMNNKLRDAVRIPLINDNILIKQPGIKGTALLFGLEFLGFIAMIEVHNKEFTRNEVEDSLQIIKRLRELAGPDLNASEENKLTASMLLSLEALMNERKIQLDKLEQT